MDIIIRVYIVRSRPVSVSQTFIAQCPFDIFKNITPTLFSQTNWKKKFLFFTVRSHTYILLQ